METFSEGRLESSLRNLEPWKRVAFLALVGGRMLPNYERFTAETGFGEISVLKQAFDAAWTWVESGRLPDNLAALRNACEQQAPDTEDFQSPYTSAALDAACVAAAILDAIDDPNGKPLTEIISLARDTVAMFVRNLLNLDSNIPGYDDVVHQHELMRRELQCQRQDLEALEKWSGNRRAAAHEFRPKVGPNPRGSLEP